MSVDDFLRWAEDDMSNALAALDLADRITGATR